MYRKRCSNTWCWAELPEMRKFPASAAALVFAVLMSCLMAFIVTSVVAWVNTGSSGGFVQRWMHAFLVAWPVAGSCILVFRPVVQRIANRLVAS